MEDEPILTPAEREAINAGRWFGSLSPSLRHDILRCAKVRRFADGHQIFAQGDTPQEWLACAKGAVRMSSTSATGKLTTLTYVEPGAWFGAMTTFTEGPRTRDAFAHGTTTLLSVSREDFLRILSQHVEFYDALLRLQATRIRNISSMVEDLNTLPLRARLAKQLLLLSQRYGVRSFEQPEEVRIGLQLVQEELAQLLGASRQRVNQELKRLEREGCIRLDPAGLVVRDSDTLHAVISQPE